MANLEDAMKRAKEINNKSREAEKAKRIQRPLTKKGFIQYFHDLFEVYNYNKPPIIKKDTVNKVSGLIRILKHNGYTDKDIYLMLDKIFERWYRLKNTEAYTNNRKPYTLDSKPNLMDIIICRDFILNKIEEKPKKIETEDSRSLIDIWQDGLWD